MSKIEGPIPMRTPNPPVSEEARLRQSSRDLEGVFVEQLFKAMRETVPENSLFDGGAGEEMFTGMMDAHFAAEVPASWDNGIADALYRQLREAALGAAAEVTPAAGELPAAEAGMQTLAAPITAAGAQPTPAIGLDR